MALQANTMVVMVKGRITHHGPCADAQTHRAVEQVFDHRLAIHALADQWVAIPCNT
jgi:iron complex transport system ATP-binding protein